MMKLILSFLLILTACSENLFDEIADKDTDEALFFEAKQEINNSNFGAAIALLESLDPAFLADRERVPVYASAYSGRCGLVFLDLLNSMQNQGSATFFGLLMTAFPGALAANVADCIQSENILQAIGNETVRDGDENLLAAFNALAKMGTILSFFADSDDDGTADGGFDQCNVDPDPDAGDLPTNMVREFGASLGVVLTSLGAIGTDYVDSTIADFRTLCTSVPQLADVCDKTEPGDFTAEEIRFIRYAIGSNDLGIDSCFGGGNNVAACAAIYEPPLAPDCQ